jgi:hypothetical protein
MRRSCLDELSTNRVLDRLSAESVRPERSVSEVEGRTPALPRT